ncbi:response regulator [Robbsia andropogonis]|uniref:response regulator n=1 Tax=Robbsia andropogonis TaxID=28092 RepID=UPI000463E576|nr:response regulator [Robbsia andropogonis]
MNTARPLDRGTIVLIEDDAHTREALSTLLSDLGAMVLAVADAEDGCATAIEALPDAVICDIVLPGMDGFYLIQSLREHEIRHGVEPAVAIALTGHDDEVHRLRSFAEGFQHFLTKPADIDALVAVLTAAINRRAR